MYGRIDLTFSGVNHDWTIPLRPRQHQPPFSPLSRSETHLCLICSGGSISTNVGLCFPAAFPPSLNSGKPGLLRSCTTNPISSPPYPSPANL